MCDVEGLEDDKLITFLAISLIQLKQKREEIVVEMPKLGIAVEKMWEVMIISLNCMYYHIK